MKGVIDQRSQCNSCVFGQVMHMGVQRVVFCQKIGRRVPNGVTQCTSYHPYGVRGGLEPWKLQMDQTGFETVDPRPGPPSKEAGYL